MAGSKVTGLVLFVLRRNVLADFLGIGATRVEPAALRRIGRRRNISLQLDPIHLYRRIGIGHS